MSSISTISGAGYTPLPVRTDGSRPSPAPAATPPAADPDHDGDSDKAGRIDVKA